MIKLIEAKKQGRILSQAEIEMWINGAVSGDIPDYQSAALLMAIRLNGMNAEETGYLTMAMLESGDRIEFPGYSKVIDKHSTGGVGDKVTIILAPLMAACGVPVAMLSGRGLGFSGGTIDKFESIIGVNCSFEIQKMQSTLDQIGWTNSMPTESLVPADRLLYGLRDVTATVDSIPLITASIMSKKIAGGATDLCLDVKCGPAAFMRSYDQAEILYQSLKRVGERCHVNVKGLISRMDEPLGCAVGNYIEMIESVAMLKKKHDTPLMGLVEDLGILMLTMYQPAMSFSQARALLTSRIEDGSALSKLYAYLDICGADDSAIMRLDSIDYTELSFQTVKAEKSGAISSISGKQVAEVARDLGAGRKKMTDLIDPNAGVLLRKTVGDSVQSGEDLAYLFGDRIDPSRIDSARQAFIIGQDDADFSGQASQKESITIAMMD